MDMTQTPAAVTTAAAIRYGLALLGAVLTTFGVIETEEQWTEISGALLMIGTVAYGLYRTYWLRKEAVTAARLR